MLRLSLALTQKSKNHLKHSLKAIVHFLLELGLSPHRLVLFVPRFLRYIHSFILFLPLFVHSRSQIKPRYLSFYPCLHDFVDEAGTASGHYFHQDLIVASLIHNQKPSIHFDVGSRVDGFIAHLLSFGQYVIIGDVRSLRPFHPRVSFSKFDLMKPCLSNGHPKYQSVSCLHVIEHIGLGRYGDTLSLEGASTALANLASVMSDDAILYISHPCGPTRIEFNAHWVFSASDFYNLLCNAGLSMDKSFFIDDDGHCDYREYPSFESICNATADSCYGCIVWACTKT